MSDLTIIKKYFYDLFAILYGLLFWIGLFFISGMQENGFLSAASSFLLGIIVAMIAKRKVRSAILAGVFISITFIFIFIQSILDNIAKDVFLYLLYILAPIFSCFGSVLFCKYSVDA